MSFQKLRATSYVSNKNFSSFLPSTYIAISQDAYGDAIAPLVHLQTLRITLPFQNNFRSDMFIADQTEKQFAESLASRFPKLYQVAFQSIHCTGPRGGGERFNAWERYDIIRGGSSNATVAVWDDPSK